MRAETEQLLREFRHRVLTREELYQLRLTVLTDFEKQRLPATILREWNFELEDEHRLRGFLTSDDMHRMIEVLEVRCLEHFRSHKKKEKRKKPSQGDAAPS